MGSINFSPDQNPYQHSYSYKSAPTYQYVPQSSFREIVDADTVATVDTIESTPLLLINSALYFLECVYILYKKDCFQLVVLHRGRVLTDKNYKTLRGAKIAFQKMYKSKAWREGVKANWIPPQDNGSDYPGVNEKNKTALNQPLKAYSI